MPIEPVNFAQNPRRPDHLAPHHCGKVLRFGFPSATCIVCEAEFPIEEVSMAMQKANNRETSPVENHLFAAAVIAQFTGRL